MEPPAAPTFSCALTREPGVITMSLKASPDGKDIPSTTRRIEIVARDSGNPKAHRAYYHSTISKATWTRCLDESFDGGNEIVPAENTPTKAAWNRFLNEHPKGGNEPVSDEDTPLLLGLIRMSFEEGGDSDKCGAGLRAAGARELHHSGPAAAGAVWRAPPRRQSLHRSVVGGRASNAIHGAIHGTAGPRRGSEHCTTPGAA